MAASRVLPQKVRPFPAHCADALLPIVTGEGRLLASSSVQSAPDSTVPGDLRSYFDSLLAAHGPQHWWPGRTRFEIIVGAILTQNTSWANVERAIRNLRAARLLSPGAIRSAPSAKLSQLLRPSGYFRQKTKTLKSFVKFLHDAHGGSLTRLFARPTQVLRDQLLSLRGIESSAPCLKHLSRPIISFLTNFMRSSFTSAKITVAPAIPAAQSAPCPAFCHNQL